MDLERKIDLYVRGELSPAEARELAQEALNRPDLFEELSAAALAKAAVESNRGPVQAIRPGSKVRIFAIVGSIAAAIAFLTVYWKAPSPNHNAIVTTTHPALKPTLDPSVKGQPILLASQLRPKPGGTPIFRGAETESRPPQQRGSIVAVENGVPTVNLGSLDGLAKGNELSVIREGQPVGRIIVTTIFRDRARGRVAAGAAIRAGDQVRTADPVYLSAVLQQMDSLTARGDLQKALDVGEKVLAQLGKNAMLLTRVGILEYQTGAAGTALDHFKAAATDAPEALNSRAALYLLQGDFERAEARLRQFQPNAQSLNNLGVAAELRGDFQKAAQYYQDALRALDGSIESKNAVQANLERVRGLK